MSVDHLPPSGIGIGWALVHQFSSCSPLPPLLRSALSSSCSPGLLYVAKLRRDLGTVLVRVGAGSED